MPLFCAWILQFSITTIVKSWKLNESHRLLGSEYTRETACTLQIRMSCTPSMASAAPLVFLTVEMIAKSVNRPLATSAAEDEVRATRRMSPAAKAHAMMLEAPSPSTVMFAPVIFSVDVVLYFPDGRYTVPPPAAWAAVIAFWMATVSSWVPLPFAPKSCTSNTR